MAIVRRKQIKNEKKDNGNTTNKLSAVKINDGVIHFRHISQRHQIHHNSSQNYILDCPGYSDNSYVNFLSLNDTSHCQIHSFVDCSSILTQFFKGIGVEASNINIKNKLNYVQIKKLLQMIKTAIEYHKDIRKINKNYNLLAEVAELGEEFFNQKTSSKFVVKQTEKINKIYLNKDALRKLKSKNLEETFLTLSAQLEQKIFKIDSINFKCAYCLQNKKTNVQIVPILASKPKERTMEQQHIEDVNKEQGNKCFTSNQTVEDINQLQQNLYNRLDNPNFIDDLSDCSTQDTESKVDKICNEFQHIAKKRALADKSYNKAHIRKFKQFTRKLKEHRIVEDAYIEKITGNFRQAYSVRINQQLIPQIQQQILQKNYPKSVSLIKTVQQFIFLDQQFDFKSKTLTKQQRKNLRRSAMTVKNKILPSTEEDDKDKQNDGLNAFMKPLALTLQKFISTDENICDLSIENDTKILQQKLKEFNRQGEQQRSQVEQKKQRLKIARQALCQQIIAKTKKNIQRLRIEVAKKDLDKLLEISQSLALAEMQQDEQTQSQCFQDKSMDETQPECKNVKDKSMDETQPESVEAQPEFKDAKDQSMDETQPESVESIEIGIMQSQKKSKNNPKSLDAYIYGILVDKIKEKDRQQQKQSGLALKRTNKGCNKDDGIKQNLLVSQNNKNSLVKGLNKMLKSSDDSVKQCNEMVQRAKEHESTIIKVQKQVEIVLEQPKLLSLGTPPVEIIQKGLQLNRKQEKIKQQCSPSTQPIYFAKLNAILILIICTLQILAGVNNAEPVKSRWKQTFAERQVDRGQQTIVSGPCIGQFWFKPWIFDPNVAQKKKSINQIAKLDHSDSEMVQQALTSNLCVSIISICSECSAYV